MGFAADGSNGLHTDVMIGIPVMGAAVLGLLCLGWAARIDASPRAVHGSLLLAQMAAVTIVVITATVVVPTVSTTSVVVSRTSGRAGRRRVDDALHPHGLEVLWGKGWGRFRLLLWVVCGRKFFVRAEGSGGSGVETWRCVRDGWRACWPGFW